MRHVIVQNKSSVTKRYTSFVLMQLQSQNYSMQYNWSIIDLIFAFNLNQV